MSPSNRYRVPCYCRPDTLLPSVQETVVLFKQRPFEFSDFVARALSLVESDDARAMGFEMDAGRSLPCKWKCADESLFGVDLCLYAFTGRYPFDKGKLGGRFHSGSVAAAVQHATSSIDFGGAHVGYVPGPGGGRFGHVDRPLVTEGQSTDCGYLMGVLAPFKKVYDDACGSIRIVAPAAEQVLISIPNEYLQPDVGNERVKLLVDVEALTAGPVPQDFGQARRYHRPGRSLFFVHPGFLAGLPDAAAQAFRSPRELSIGRELGAPYFHIFDSHAALCDGVPVERLLPYVKHILASTGVPYPLAAAVTQTSLEYSRLTDRIRHEGFRSHAFASFSGVFIDIYDRDVASYVNLFQPLGVTFKPAGQVREVEVPPSDVHELVRAQTPRAPIMPLRNVLGYDVRPEEAADKLTFTTADTPCG